MKPIDNEIKNEALLIERNLSAICALIALTLFAFTAITGKKVNGELKRENDSIKIAYYHTQCEQLECLQKQSDLIISLKKDVAWLKSIKKVRNIILESDTLHYEYFENKDSIN